MAPTPVKIRADFELMCSSFEGIDAIKAALIAGRKAVNDEHFEAGFKMIAPPVYKCEVYTLEKQKAITKLEEAMKIIEEVIL
jgi:translation initiation factor 2 subunit 1